MRHVLPSRGTSLPPAAGHSGKPLGAQRASPAGRSLAGVRVDGAQIAGQKVGAKAGMVDTFKGRRQACGANTNLDFQPLESKGPDRPPRACAPSHRPGPSGGSVAILPGYSACREQPAAATRSGALGGAVLFIPGKARPPTRSGASWRHTRRRPAGWRPTVSAAGSVAAVSRFPHRTGAHPASGRLQGPPEQVQRRKGRDANHGFQLPEILEQTSECGSEVAGAPGVSGATQALAPKVRRARSSVSPGGRKWVRPLAERSCTPECFRQLAPPHPSRRQRQKAHLSASRITRRTFSCSDPYTAVVILPKVAGTARLRPGAPWLTWLKLKKLTNSGTEPQAVPFGKPEGHGGQALRILHRGRLKSQLPDPGRD